MAKGNIPAKPEKVAKKERMYSSIWQAIRAADVGTHTLVRVHTSSVERVIQAVRKEKSRETAVKRGIGMLRPGPMDVTHNPEVVDGKVNPDYSIIKFSLQWNGNKL